MLGKYGVFLGVISVFLMVVFVSGCVNVSSNSSKHYEEGNLSCDYPSDWIIDTDQTVFNVKFEKQDFWSAVVWCGITIIPLESGESYNDFVKSDFGSYPHDIFSADGTNVSYASYILSVNGTPVKVGNYTGISYSFIRDTGAFYIAYINCGDVVCKVEVGDNNIHTSSKLNQSEGYKAFNKILGSLQIKT